MQGRIAASRFHGAINAIVERNSEHENQKVKMLAVRLEVVAPQ
jgi:hypothetical protein